MENIEIIKHNVLTWVDKHLKGFQFRQYQLEYIVSTINSILDGNQLNVIEAPTGSGKSIIIMIMAGVLDESYGYTSYILCSDLYLWQQYADAIDKYNLYFGKIKGTFGNYECEENHQDLSLAPCRLAYIPYTSLFDYQWAMNNGWACATSCPYMIERKKAIESNVTLMTYQLYFPYMNDLEIQKNSPFGERDIVFCDECHNIPSLCQQYGTIPLEIHKDIDKFRTLLEFCMHNKNFKDLELTEDFIDKYLEKFYDIYLDIMKTPYNEQTKLRNLLNDYWDHMSTLLECYAEIQKVYINKSKVSHKRLTKREYNAIDIAKWVDKHSCSIKIYMRYSEGHDEYLVKTDNSYRVGKTTEWPSNPQVCYKFAKEDVWVYEFILKHQEIATVMLSATVGDHNAFDDNIGTKYMLQKSSIMYQMPSTFNFDNSPIYYIPGNKMSLECIDVSMEKNAKIINAILKSNKHINEKGIIHTGSYKNAQTLIKFLDDDVKQRIYTYTEAKEKNLILEEYSNSLNGVLIGPTLTEGIDLPEDGCRFIIILKIPYPYLGDELVRAKSALFPRWYNSQTSNNVIQGIGRGNRTPTDWCTTYILDGCFTNLYESTRNQYPTEFYQRIKILK